MLQGRLAKFKFACERMAGSFSDKEMFVEGFFGLLSLPLLVSEEVRLASIEMNFICFLFRRNLG